MIPRRDVVEYVVIPGLRSMHVMYTYMYMGIVLSWTVHVQTETS